MPIYAFAAALGGSRVIDAARLLATQSGIPERKLKLIDASATYAHIDPISAYPHNDFVRNLIPFLDRTESSHKHRHRHKGHKRGHHRDRDSDRDRGKHRDRDRDRDRGKHRDRDRDRDDDD
jgi:hypothetical protein